MKKLVIIISMLGLLCCSPFHQVQPFYSVETVKMAILPFTGRGAGISQRSGHIAADRLTTYLYLKKQISVVDRSQVSHVLHHLGIKNTYFLGKKELIEIADTLDASIVVLGLLENEAKQAHWKTPVNTLTVTLRFLDGKTGEILHILHKRDQVKSEPDSFADTLLKTMVCNL